MSEIQNLRAFKVTFLSPTNHRGARVKIVDVTTKHFKRHQTTWSKMRDTIVLPYCYKTGCITDQAIEHMQSVGLSVVAETQIGRCVGQNHLQDYESEHIILSDSWSDGPRSEYLDLDGKTLEDYE